MKCFSQNAEQQLSDIFLIKSLNEGYITFYKLFIPSSSKKRSDWAHPFLQKARGERGIKSRSLSLHVSKRHQHLFVQLMWSDWWWWGNPSASPLRDIREQPPTWLRSFREEPRTGTKGSDGGGSGDLLGWTFSKLDKLKPLNTLLPPHTQSVSGNTRCFKNKFPLGSIFFPKAQPPLQHSLNWTLLLNQLFHFCPQSF